MPSAYLGLNNDAARASVFIGMKARFIVPVVLVSFLVIACEQKSAEPSGGQPQSTPTSSAAPAPTMTPPATPASTPTVTPQTTPAAPTPSPAATAPSPTSSTSDSRPTLSSQPANEYLQSYDAYITDFKMAYHAMKQGDMTKYQTVILRARELQTKGEKLGGELSPDEEKRFADYLNKKADELAQFASQNR
jgi:hypothetical protein